MALANNSVIVTMFIVYDTGKMAIMSQPRCGHTVLSQFLNATPEQTFYDINKWADSNNRIIILRHPIQRLNSAIKTYDVSLGQTLKSYDQSLDKDAFIQELFPNQEWIAYIKRMIALPRREAWEFNVFKMHSMPYMHFIKDCDFRYIDFDKLESYFPKHGEHYLRRKISPMVNERSKTYEAFPENQYFTETEFNKEIALYYQFLDNKTELSVEEWNELVKSPAP